MNIKPEDYRMFEIYAREYKKFIFENNKDRIDYTECKMKDINEELTIYIKEISILDKEFKENSNELPDPLKYFIEYGKMLNPNEYINNTKWNGFWKKCTGKDLEYFISYLEYPILYPNHKYFLDNHKNLIKTFKNETGFETVPYGVICAERINRKYFK